MQESVTRLHTLKAFAEAHPAFTVPALRSLVFKSKDRQSSRGAIKGNGFDTAIVRIGRKLLIDEAKFFAWIAGQQGGDHHAA